MKQPKLISPENCYFVVYEDNEYNSGIVAAIVSKEFWDEKHCLSDRAPDFKNPVGWARIIDSIYDSGCFSLKKAHINLASQGFVFSKELALFMTEHYHSVYMDMKSYKPLKITKFPKKVKILNSINNSLEGWSEVIKGMGNKSKRK